MIKSEKKSLKENLMNKRHLIILVASVYQSDNEIKPPNQSRVDPKNWRILIQLPCCDVERCELKAELFAIVIFKIRDYTK